MKYAFIGLGLLGIVLISFALEYAKTSAPAPAVEQQPLPRGVVTIGSTTIAVEIANTHQARRQGLSGRTTLPQGTGMLFTFEQGGAWGIWMKDMLFPIDIIWADEDGRIITIAHDVSPATYPNSFYPERAAHLVLEVPAGFAQAHGIAEGAQLVVQ